MSILEATVEKAQWPVLRKAFDEAAQDMPTVIDHSYLAQSTADPDVWRIMTVWQSQAALQRYRASVQTPEGVAIFGRAGAEPRLSVFAIEAYAASLDGAAGL